MSKKTIICSSVEYADIRIIESVENGVVTFKNAGDSFSVLKTVNATLTESSSPSDAGLVVTQDLVILAEMELSLANVFERIPQVYRLTTDSGSVYIFGNLDKKVRLDSMVRNFDETTLSLQRLTTSHEF
jgi:hypothetical protein